MAAATVSPWARQLGRYGSRRCSLRHRAQDQLRTPPLLDDCAHRSDNRSHPVQHRIEKSEGPASAPHSSNWVRPPLVLGDHYLLACLIPADGFLTTVLINKSCENGDTFNVDNGNVA